MPDFSTVLVPGEDVPLLEFRDLLTDTTIYFPDQTDFVGSLALGTGLRNLAHSSGEQGQYNLTVGIEGTGEALGTGHSNILIGPNVGTALSDFSVANGYTGNGGNAGNVVIGRNCCSVADGMYDCTFIGLNAGLNATNCMDNVGVGINALKNIEGGSENFAGGVDALLNLVGSGDFATGTGHRNTGLGGFAGRFLNDGTTPKVAGKEGLFLGYNSRSSGDTSREVVIGPQAEGNGSNTVTIGAATNLGIYMNGTLNVGDIVASTLATTPAGTIQNTTFTDDGGQTRMFLDDSGSTVHYSPASHLFGNSDGSTVFADLAAARAVFSGYIRGATYVVSGLPSAATAGAGARAFVTDATAPSFGVAVVGGGAVKVPVYSDGSTWLVG